MRKLIHAACAVFTLAAFWPAEAEVINRCQSSEKNEISNLPMPCDGYYTSEAITAYSQHKLYDGERMREARARQICFSKLRVRGSQNIQQCNDSASRAALYSRWQAEDKAGRVRKR
ncbi:MAG: hypothetical protein LBO00_06115 [Zoogloeaceae bacterium]|jgi:hypothetical protein|nr:hypothetical protein [Zoogloeaceae bacterium]